MMLSEVSRDDYTRTFKSTSVSDVYLIFLGESFEWPRQILSTPPPHTPTEDTQVLACWQEQLPQSTLCADKKQYI